MKCVRIIGIVVILLIFLPQTAEATYHRETSSITISTSKASIAKGEKIVVSGEVIPSQVLEDVILNYTRPDGEPVIRNSLTDLLGSYSDHFEPEMSGTWRVISSWGGNSRYEGDTSPPVSFEVEEQAVSASSISITTSSSSISVDSSLSITGLVTPHIATEITLEVAIEDLWQTLTRTTAAADGTYSYTWTPIGKGTYQLRASWPGNTIYDSSTSDVLTVFVRGLSSSVLLDISTKSLIFGERFDITGSVFSMTPGQVRVGHGNVPILLTYLEPSGNTRTEVITSGPDGSFSYFDVPSLPGVWKVSASWEGSNTYETAESETVIFTVEETVEEETVEETVEEEATLPIPQESDIVEVGVPEVTVKEEVAKEGESTSSSMSTPPTDSVPEPAIPESAPLPEKQEETESNFGVIAIVASLLILVVAGFIIFKRRGRMPKA